MEAVERKRLKCDRSLRRKAVYFVVFHYFFGGGEWESLNEILKCVHSKKAAAKQSVLSSLFPVDKILECNHSKLLFHVYYAIQKWFRLAFESNG